MRRLRETSDVFPQVAGGPLGRKGEGVPSEGRLDSETYIHTPTSPFFAKPYSGTVVVTVASMVTKILHKGGVLGEGGNWRNAQERKSTIKV